MSSIVDRNELMELLHQWRHGVLSEREVQERAETLFEERGAGKEIAHSDDESIPLEVLIYLDGLPALLVTTEDIGAMIEFLNTPEGQADEGWRKWTSYWDGIDDATRRLQLRDNPFYFS